MATIWIGNLIGTQDSQHFAIHVQHRFEAKTFKHLFRKSFFLLLSSRIFKPVTASNQLLLDVAEAAVDAS